MSKTRSNPTIGDNVKAFLADGKPRTIEEIFGAVAGKNKSIDTAVRRLKKKGEIARVDTGIYRLNKEQDTPAVVENSRGEAENTETINKMLNLYDKLLDTVAVSIGMVWARGGDALPQLFLCAPRCNGVGGWSPQAHKTLYGDARFPQGVPSVQLSVVNHRVTRLIPPRRLSV